MIRNVRNTKKYTNYGISNVVVNNDETNVETNGETNNQPQKQNKPISSTPMNDYKKLLQINRFNRQIGLESESKLKNINYENYLESDILKLLAFLKLYGIVNNKSIKIVCHSALMKKFLNKKILNPVQTSLFEKRKLLSTDINNKKLKYIEKKENMWSIILNDNSKLNITESQVTSTSLLDRSICITRHAFTNANIYKEQSKTYNPFTKVISRYKQFTDIDTKLSLYGILGALDFNSPAINLDNCDNTVFVSVLVRTWITALCLYLPKIGDDDKLIKRSKNVIRSVESYSSGTSPNNDVESSMFITSKDLIPNFKGENLNSHRFKLVVSPFIKEHGITLDNMPIPLSKQIIIIKNFLKFLRTKFSNNQSTEKYEINANKINSFFNNGGILEIYGVKKIKDTTKYIKYQIRYDKNKNCYFSESSIEKYFTTIINNYDNKLGIDNLSILPGVRKPTSIMINKNINPNNEPLTENKVTNFKNCVLNMNIGIIDINEYEEKFTDEDINKFYNKNKDIIKDSNILVVCSQHSLSSGKEHFQHKLRDKIEKETTINYNFKNTNKIDSSTTFDKSGNRVRIYTKGLDNDKLKIKFYKDSGKDEHGGPEYDSILCECQYDDYKFYILHIVFSGKFNEEIILQLKLKYGVGKEKIFYAGLPEIYGGLNSNVNIIKNSKGEFYKNKIPKEGKKLKFNIEKNTNPKYTYFIKYIELKNNAVKNTIIVSNLGTTKPIIQNQRSSTGSKSSDEYLSIWSNNPRNSIISNFSNKINQNLSNNL
jgi:hypothetical protein